MAPTPSQLKAAFAVFDTDGSGTLTPDELKAILTRPAYGRPPRFSSEQVDAIVKQFDTNGDGVLSFDEFVKAWSSMSEKTASLDELMALVVAPADEDFSDLVPEGAGCAIAKTEERAIMLKQLYAVKKHVERRCGKEGCGSTTGTSRSQRSTRRCTRFAAM